MEPKNKSERPLYKSANFGQGSERSILNIDSIKIIITIKITLIIYNVYIKTLMLGSQ